MSAFDHSSAVAASNGYDNHRRALDDVDFVDLIKTIHADPESKHEGLRESTLHRTTSRSADIMNPRKPKANQSSVRSD